MEYYNQLAKNEYLHEHSSIFSEIIYNNSTYENEALNAHNDSSFADSKGDVNFHLNPDLNLDEDIDNDCLYYIKNEETKTYQSSVSKKLFESKIKNKQSSGGMPSYFKLDSCFKNFKVNINKNILDLINSDIAKYPEFNSAPKKLKKIDASFTTNCDYLFNFDMLSMTIKELLLSTPQNWEIIKKIENGNFYVSEKIKSFLNSNYEEAIRAFYDNKKIFDKFRKDPVTKFYEEKFKAIKGFSLVENYGILKFIKFESFPRKKEDQELLRKKRERL